MPRKYLTARHLSSACLSSRWHLLTRMRQSPILSRMADTAYKVPAVTLGWRLRMSMEQAGFKADYMAAKLHVHRGTITRWTHDIGSPPKAIYVERWAQITGVPLGWLANGDSSREAGRNTDRCSPLLAA